jgi:putative SOS response-associated peptidase YedK
MNRFHKPTNEKRMVVILQVARFSDWLDAKSDIMGYMVPFNAEQLRAVVPVAMNTSLI